MRIIRRSEKATEKIFRFKCPVCGSELEAEEHELYGRGLRSFGFICPVCGGWRIFHSARDIVWSDFGR